MCIKMTIENKEVKVGTRFKLHDSIIMQNNPLSLSATMVKGDVFWDGYVKEEDLQRWLSSKRWHRTEIFATRFNQRNRWYDVPPGQIIKGITYNSKTGAILKIVTREARGKELDIQDRFAVTEKRKLIL